MIRPLRRAHFTIWVVITPLLFALLIAGLWARRTTTPINRQFHVERFR